MEFPFATLGAGLLGGLFGGGPSIPPEQKRLLRMQTQAAKQLQQYSQGVPGSDPQELQALASQRGLLGQQQRATMGGLFANLGPQGPVDQNALLGDLTTQFTGQQSSLLAQALQAMFERRRQALVQSAQIAAGALPAAQPTQGGFDLGAALGPLAQALAYQQGLKGAQLQQRQPSIVNVGGQRPTQQATGFGFGGGMGLGNVTFNPGRLSL